MSATITLSSLTCALPDGRVLFSDLNFSFNQERTGIAGRNGIGKTTLLRLISGDQAPTAGKITVNGSVGVLRQLQAPPEGMTLADLFGVRAGLARLRKAEAGGRPKLTSPKPTGHSKPGWPKVSAAQG